MTSPTLTDLRRLHTGLRGITMRDFASTFSCERWPEAEEWHEYVADPLGYCSDTQRDDEHRAMLLEMAWRMGSDD